MKALAVLFFLLGIVSIVLLVVGLIKPTITCFWKPKNERTRKSVFVGYVIGFFICFVAFLICAPSSSSTEKTSNVAVSKQATEKEKASEEKSATEREAAKNDFSNFMNQFTEIDNTYAQVFSTKWKGTFSGMADGSVSVYNAYETMGKLQNYSNNVANKIRKLEIPSSLPKEDRELLKKARNDYAQGIDMQGYAAKKAKDMLDNGKMKPSEIQDVKETMQVAEGDKIKAVTNMVTLAQKYDYDFKNPESAESN